MRNLMIRSNINRIQRLLFMQRLYIYLVVLRHLLNNLGMLGQYYDVETGLYQNGFRDYMAAKGGYLQFDPILHPANGPPSNVCGSKSSTFFDSLLGNSTKLNPYIYSLNNPIYFIDRNGLAAYEALVNLKSAGVIGGGAIMYGGVKTKCVDKKRQRGFLFVVFVGADVGIPVSSTVFTMTLEDNAPSRGDLKNLKGFARIFSLSGAFGIGGSVTHIMLGQAETSGGVSIGPQLGIDWAAMGMSGWSSISSIKEECCDE